MHKVLLVEDSVEAGQLVQRALGQSVQLDWVRTVREASTQLQKKDYELMLLDANLPDGDGFQLCSILQTHERFHSMPVMLLTAKSSISDKVMGFAVGAEDYICKPFDMLELKARVEAKLRKRALRALNNDVKVFDGLEIDMRTHRVTITEGGGAAQVDLTPIEFKLLVFLASRPNTVVNRDEILNAVWGQNVHVYHRSVDTHVSKLRKKLGPKSHMIACVHGTGYRFVDEPKDRSASVFEAQVSGPISGPRLQLGHVS